jgi:uncharacterized protein (TIGR02246 family)
MSPDEQAIRELNSTWIAAVNAGDLARLLTLMTDDCVLLNPGGEPIGRDGFPAVFQGGHRQGRIHCISDIQEVVIVGEVAYTRCRDSLSVTPFAPSTPSAGSGQAHSGQAHSGQAGGETLHLAGYRLTVWRKQPDGRWLLARDAHTLSAVQKRSS